MFAKAKRLVDSPLTEAFDLSKESAKVREAYGNTRTGQGALMGRRLLETGEMRNLHAPIDEFMGTDPKSVGPDQLVEEAQRLLTEFRIDQVAVVDGDGRPVGLLDVQDLLDVRI